MVRHACAAVADAVAILRRKREERERESNSNSCRFLHACKVCVDSTCPVLPACLCVDLTHFRCWQLDANAKIINGDGLRDALFICLSARPPPVRPSGRRRRRRRFPQKTPAPMHSFVIRQTFVCSAIFYAAATAVACVCACACAYDCNTRIAISLCSLLAGCVLCVYLSLAFGKIKNGRKIKIV